eukprot:218438-Rhodomonas_salina.3
MKKRRRAVEGGFTAALSHGLTTVTLVLQRGEVVLVTDGTSSSCRGTAIFVVLPVRSTKKMYCNCPLLQYKHGVDFQHSILSQIDLVKATGHHGRLARGLVADPAAWSRVGNWYPGISASCEERFRSASLPSCTFAVRCGALKQPDTGSTGLTLYTSAPLRIPRARRAMSSTDIACGFCADQPDPRLMRIPAIRMTAGEENEEKNQLLSGVTGLFLFRDAPAA